MVIVCTSALKVSKRSLDSFEVEPLRVRVKAKDYHGESFDLAYLA